jgi:hypothetical protein
MSILDKQRAALESYLVATPGIPAVAHQNVIYTPTTGTSFIKATFVPAMIRPAVRGPNPQLRYDSLFTILICTPENKGSGAGYAIADTLLDRFKATTDIAYEDIFVSVEYSEVGTSYLTPPFYCTPLTVTVYSYR